MPAPRSTNFDNVLWDFVAGWKSFLQHPELIRGSCLKLELEDDRCSAGTGEIDFQLPTCCERSLMTCLVQSMFLGTSPNNIAQPFDIQPSQEKRTTSPLGGTLRRNSVLNDVKCTFCLSAMCSFPCLFSFIWHF